MPTMDDLAVALALQDAAPTVKCNIFIWGGAQYSSDGSRALITAARQMGFTPVELCLSGEAPPSGVRMGWAQEPGCDRVTVAASAHGLDQLPGLLSSGDLLFINGYNLTPVQWQLLSTHMSRELSHGRLRARPLLVLAPADASVPPPLVNGALHLELAESQGADTSRDALGISPRRIIQTLNSRQFLAEWNRRHRETWAYIAKDPVTALSPGPIFTPLARRAIPRAQNWALASACWAACSLLNRDPLQLMAGAVGPMGARRALSFSASDHSSKAPWDIAELNGAPRPGSIASLLRRHPEHVRRDPGHNHPGRPPLRLGPTTKMDEGRAL